MDLVEEQTLSATSSAGQWACPMQCEGDKTYDQPGDCPVCGMDLVPVQPELSAEDKTYNTLRKKFWVALAFTLPIFIIAMSRSEEHTSELQSRGHLVCRLLLEK